ncbi:MAG: DUF86 domain-containing protein [Gammaproteobacteria bacterium]
MRREELYLQDIVEAAEAIKKFLADIDYSSFQGSDLVRSAVLQKLTMIGEAAARIPKEFQARYTDVEWADIIAFRNIAVHAYFAVNWDIVWTTATEDVFVLEEQIDKILQLEFPKAAQ